MIKTEAMKGTIIIRDRMEEPKETTTIFVITARFEVIPFNDVSKYMDVLIPKARKSLLMFMVNSLTPVRILVVQD